jgi:hypothetical protein
MFPLARRVCPAQNGRTTSMELGDEPSLAPTMPLWEEEPMVDRADPTGGLELARPAAPAPARPRTTLAAVARPAGEVAGLLLVEVLGTPWARPAGCPQSMSNPRAARDDSGKRTGS